MKKEYDEIMEHIEVTPEMRRRVLQHIQEENISAPSPKILRFSSFKKYLSIAACFVILLVGAVALPHVLNGSEPEPPVLTGPNIVEAASLRELSELAGFEVTTDFTLPFEPKETTYCSYWNEMAQIEYCGEEYSATYRQSLGTDDNSGDYNTYGDTIEIVVNHWTVTLKGNNGAYVLAVWTDGVYSYSLSLSPGVAEDIWRNSLGQ